MSTTEKPEVYRVGLFADLFRLKRTWDRGPEPIERKIYDFWQNFKALCRKRGYWDGWHADSGQPHVGHGWTAERALKSLTHIEETQYWARHKCGTVRLTANVRTHYCQTCKRYSRWGWVALTPDEVDR